MATGCASRRTMRRSDLAAALSAVLAVTLGGCSLAPALEAPDVPIAAAYREEAPWTPARPADELPRDAWWTVYGDAQLDAMQLRLLENSSDLAAAFARYRQAKAFTDQLRSGLYP